MNRQISVIGSSTPAEDEYGKAETIGSLLGEANVTLICGGKGGVMEAACRGLREASGGQTVGILPGDGFEEGNSYLDVVIPTGTGNARNLAVVQSGRAIIAIGGSFGTLSEIAIAVKIGRPVYGVSTWAHPDFSYPENLDPTEAVNRAVQHLKEHPS